MNRGLAQLPIMIDRGSAVPIQDQLFLAIRDLISRGVAKPSTRLPPSRELSRQLSISRNTVKTAYANLISQGYLLSQGTSGTFVATRPPETPFVAPADRPPLDEDRRRPAALPGRGETDFSPRGANPALAPERTWRRLLITHLPFQSRQSARIDPAGLPTLREAVANAISPLRGMTVDPAHCAIVPDDYRALDTASRALIRGNRRVVVEDPCDAGLHYLLRSQGADVIPVPVDRQGLRVEDLPEGDVAAVFVTPSHQQPTGVTMSRARRLDLLDWANRHDAHVVEWDTFGEFCYDYTMEPSLYSLDASERTIHINGFSCWISTGAQLCCVALPPKLVRPFLAIKPFLNPEPNWLEQRAATDFINSDSLFGHMRRARKHFRLVRDTILHVMEERFPGHELTGTGSGRHMVWRPPDAAGGALALQRRALDAGVRIPTLNDGYLSFDRERLLYDPDRTLLLGYAMLDEERARAAMLKLASTFEK